MKIVILTTGLSRGGAEKQLCLLANYLQKTGRQLVILPLSREEDFDYKYILENAGVKLLTSRYFTNNISVWNCILAFFLIIEFKAGSIITFNYPANILGRCVKLFCPKLKIITSIRNSFPGSVLREMIFKLSMNFDDLVVFNSDNVRNTFIQRNMTKAANSVTIKNAVFFKSTKPESLDNFNRQNINWVCIGRYDRQKNHDLLLRTFLELTNSFDNCFLHLYGSGPLKNAIEDFVINNNLSGKIFINHRVDDVFSILINAHVLILASDWEGYPNVILEALGVGVPVVSTDVGGVNELVLDGWNGFLVKKGNKDELLNAMHKIMNLNNEDYLMFSKNAIESVVNNNFDTIMDNWNNEINKLIGKC